MPSNCPRWLSRLRAWWMSRTKRSISSTPTTRPMPLRSQLACIFQLSPQSRPQPTDPWRPPNSSTSSVAASRSTATMISWSHITKCKILITSSIRPWFLKVDSKVETSKEQLKCKFPLSLILKAVNLSTISTWRMTTAPEDSHSGTTSECRTQGRIRHIDSTSWILWSLIHNTIKGWGRFYTRSRMLSNMEWDGTAKGPTSPTTKTLARVGLILNKHI
jgi:hypothetical protein